MIKLPQFNLLTGIGISLLLMMFTSHGFAQSNNPGPRIGIKGGANLSQFFVDQPTVEDENMKVGLHFGIFTKIPVTNFLAFQPELLYTNVGSKISYGGSTVGSVLGIREGQVRYNLNYIQLPLAMAINLGPLNIHAGPYVSYLVSANVKNLRTSDLTTISTIELNNDDFNSMDYGLLAGVGFDISNVTIGARYNYGLRQVGKEGMARNLTNNSRNAVAQLYIGFGF
ncbi:MAG: PorT family protein [Mongoliibacter sp.]|uniref:porin family protein n=1 Tax=Mongoliibacter sp. TaxID=2022438 RepID=UPI0012F23D76|nr:porin family protein [Mongoliibacter sp.]TVP44961.1 MAG: PorT family protein [Mongoliibacter sp.]